MTREQVRCKLAALIWLYERATFDELMIDTPSLHNKKRQVEQVLVSLEKRRLIKRRARKIFGVWTVYWQSTERLKEMVATL